MKKYFLLIAVLVAALGVGAVKADKNATIRALAEQGDAHSQVMLGFAYATGDGVDKDLRTAADWYRKAAEQGLALGQSALAYIYTAGEGVDKDVRKGIEWYRRAAEQGMAGAQYSLGLAYAKGEGATQDYREAYVWFLMGKAGGHEQAKEGLRIVARKLTSSETRSAKKEAKSRMAQIEKRANKSE